MTFATPILLIGLLAAGIPFLLHFVSRVRAKEQPFPSLRFLRQSLVKTARRRRLENWLLLLLRSLALAALAMAVAEPIRRWAHGEAPQRDPAAAVILDTSYSMSVRRDGETRFSRAKIRVGDLLSGAGKPALATLLVTSADAPVPPALRTQLDTIRKDVTAAEIAFGSTSLPAAFARAVDRLTPANPNGSIYVLGDLQRRSVEPLLQSSALARAEDLRLFFVQCAEPEVHNVGIADAEILGRCIADGPLTFRVTLINSSTSARTVELAFRAESAKQSTARKITQTLSAAGRDGAAATVEFTERFSEPGEVKGDVRILSADDLPVDNVWRFCLSVAPRIRALVVQGPSRSDEAIAYDPGAMLALALDWRTDEQASRPWPLRVQRIRANEVDPEIVSSADAVFFCDVPSFSPTMAEAIARFVREGGMAMFFLGPDVQVENYNARFGPSGVNLLPGTLGASRGQVGPAAAVFETKQVDTDHPLFAGLFDRPGEYLAAQTQRYVKLSAGPDEGKALMTLGNGDPLLLERWVENGPVFWCTTTASRRWTDLPSQPLFLPMVVRAALLSDRRPGGISTYTAGQTAPIHARGAAKVRVMLPTEGSAPSTRDLPRSGDEETVRFAETQRVGWYRWEALDSSDQVQASGAFAVNPLGPECDLSAYTPEAWTGALRARGLRNVYAGTDVTELRARARRSARGRNWWDVLTAATMFLLLVEMFLAHRRREGEPWRRS